MGVTLYPSRVQLIVPKFVWSSVVKRHRMTVRGIIHSISLSDRESPSHSLLASYRLLQLLI